jgi:hypothetical protein
MDEGFKVTSAKGEFNIEEWLFNHEMKEMEARKKANLISTIDRQAEKIGRLLEDEKEIEC